MPPVYPSFTPTFHTAPYGAIDPSQSALSCQGKVVFVTGGGKGIGKAFATGFAKAHAKGIVILGRTEGTLQSTASELQDISGGVTVVLPVIADICDATSVNAAFDAAVRHFGSLDILINNAGGLSGKGAIADVDIDEFWKTFEVNIKGPLIVTQAFLRAAKSSSETKTIINISSAVAHMPYAPGQASYAVSKLAFTKIIEYVANEHPDWRVFNLQPGVVETDLAKQVGRKGRDEPELPGSFAVWLARSPDAEFLKGRFVWANWDVPELLARQDEIVQRDILKLWLRGWGDDPSTDLTEMAKSTHGDANRS